MMVVESGGADSLIGRHHEGVAGAWQEPQLWPSTLRPQITIRRPSQPPLPPSCPSSAPQSSTLAASPRSVTFATTRSARSSQRTSPNGTRSCVSSLRTTTDQDRNRQALRYIIRNTTLPQRVRAQAQLQLSQMHCYTRFTQVKNRCIMGGKGRGVFSDFRLGRVRVPKTHKSGSSADNFHSTSSVSTHLLETCPV